MKRSMRRREGLAELFCARMNRSHRRGGACEDPACSGAEHDLASGDEGRPCGCERDSAWLVRQGRELYGDLDEVEEPDGGTGR